MELRFAHLADYAAADASGKITLVGIFDVVWDQLKLRPIPFPPCYLVASLAASLSEGSAHRLEARLLDADHQKISDLFDAEVGFQTSGPGHPLRTQVIVGFGPGALRVPELGEYVIRVVVDGLSQGEIPLVVRDLPPQG